jgi:glucarate dehydratase
VRTIIEVETDEGLVGFEYEGGSIKIPDGPGLGVSLDRDKLDEYTELYEELGGYPYDRDPGYPSRYPLEPKQRFADPHKSITPQIPTGQAGRFSGAGAR